jgi:hypothetical protein
MDCYLISRTADAALDTIVFTAGPTDKEEAVAVFTDVSAAQSYIDKAGWSEQYSVASVEPIPFLRWLLKAYDEGVHYLVVDPDYDTQQRGESQNTLSIEAHLEHASSHILQVARPDF